MTRVGRKREEKKENGLDLQGSLRKILLLHGGGSVLRMCATLWRVVLLWGPTTTSCLSLKACLPPPEAPHLPSLAAVEGRWGSLEQALQGNHAPGPSPL